ncbi:monocarboxylate transporter 9-like [Diadema antillarum]|uniref:monocarboxylate transporter 9-like n=1 Tax=Diadema antillarum TaxID=105358 RepID=UPI003A8B8656
MGLLLVFCVDLCWQSPHLIRNKPEYTQNLAAAPLVSYLYRRIPRSLLITGAVTHSLGLVLASLAKSNAELAAALSLAGLGVGIVWMAGLLELGRLPESKFGLYLGIGSAGFPVGMFVVPLIGNFLMNIYGWRGAMLIVGGVTGGGLGIIWMSGLLELGRLQESNFGLYLGLGSAGFPVGMFVVPLIGDFLMRIYGWRGAMLIVGGLTAHVIPLSMLNQPQIDNNSRNVPLTTNLECSKGENGDCTITEDGELIAQQSQPSTSTYFHGYEGINTVESNEQIIGLPKHDTHMSTSEEDFYEEKAEINSDSFSDERTELLKEATDSSSQDNVPRRLERWAQTIKESDFYTNPCLVIFLFASTLHGITYGGWHTFLIPRAVERGMLVLQAITLSFCAGLANVVGRIGIGVLADRFGRAMDTILFSTFLLALSLLCDVFVTNFAVTYIMSCLEAFSIASRAVLIYVVIKERAPRDYDTAFAIQVLTLGLGLLLGSYLAGIVADKFRSYNASFTLFVCIEVLQFVLLFPLR